MTSISQNYIKMIQNLIQKHILEATSNISINSYDDVFNYINLIQNFDSILTKTITLRFRDDKRTDIRIKVLIFL